MIFVARRGTVSMGRAVDPTREEVTRMEGVKSHIWVLSPCSSAAQQLDLQ